MPYPIYYGNYQSATTSITGCVKKFVSVPQKDILFPPQVSYHCDLCDQEHNFTFASSWLIASVKQQNDLEKFCSENNIEKNVDIS